MAVAHGPYYSFYSIYLGDHGYSKSHIGWLWGLGVICEIGVFLLAPRLFQRFAIEQVLMAVSPSPCCASCSSPGAFNCRS